MKSKYAIEYNIELLKRMLDVYLRGEAVATNEDGKTIIKKEREETEIKIKQLEWVLSD